MVLVAHKVLVFQSRCVRSSALYLPTESAPFQIVDSLHIVFVVKPESVAHEDEVHLLIVLHLDRVDAVDARQERVGVLLQVLVHLGQNLFDQDALLITHSLHNEASVVAEKEETARSTGSLTRLKDLVSVRPRVKRLLNLVKVDVVHGSHPLEDTGREGRDLGAREIITPFCFARLLKRDLFLVTLSGIDGQGAAHKIHASELVGQGALCLFRLGELLFVFVLSFTVE